MSHSTDPTADGRSARRHRNRDAVLDAVHELFVEGVGTPTSEEVAARSGVSLRSIYRYFPERQEMLRAALTRRVRVAEPLFVLPGLGQGTREERVAAFVDHRLGLYALIAPTARVALSGTVVAPGITEMIERRRLLLREQVREQFAPELDALPAPEGDDLQVAIDVLCQFEALELLTLGWAVPLESVHRILVTSVTALIQTT